MSKKRSRCQRLFLLSDEDLIEVLCCGSNMENLSTNINRVFNQISSLKIDVIQNDKKILGFYGINNEYVPLKTVLFLNT